MLSLLLNGLALLTPAPLGLHAQSPQSSTGLSRRAVLGGAFVAAVPAAAFASSKPKQGLEDEYTVLQGDIAKEEALLKQDESKLYAAKDRLKKVEAQLKADKKAAEAAGLPTTNIDDCDDAICLAEKKDLEKIAALKNDVKEYTRVQKKLQAEIIKEVAQEEVLNEEGLY